MNTPLSDLHILTIENYIVKHDMIHSLTLSNVCMTTEHIGIMVSVLTYSESLRKVDFKSNYIKDIGAKVFEKIISSKEPDGQTNTCQIQSLDLSSNMFSEKGIMSLLEGLKHNDNLVEVTARHNMFKINPRILAIIGDLVVYHNRTLKKLDLINTRAAKYFENPMEPDEEEEKMVMFMPGQKIAAG